MPRARRWRLAILAFAVAIACLVLPRVPRYVRAAAFVARAAGAKGRIATLAARHATRPFRETDVVIPSRQGPLRARIYRPDAVRQTIVIPPGLHGMGIDEPRMVAFARDLAASGVVVITPELADLKQYRITVGSVDAVEDAALWVLAQPPLVQAGPPALAGISFSGGLSIVAAGRPALRHRLALVASIGGHGDLPRVLRYLCSAPPPGGTAPLPHDYGMAVLALNLADRLVPAGQRDALREGIRQFLHASHLAVFDQAAARDAFEQARAAEAALPEPASTVMRLVNDRDVGRLADLLRPHVAGWGEEAALSPERSPCPGAPVYLLHGSHDTVIPAQESILLSRRLEPCTKVHLVVTPLLNHVELDYTRGIGDLVRLVAFWADVLE